MGAALVKHKGLIFKAALLVQSRLIKAGIWDVELEDLVQEATIVFLEAQAKYDESRGAKLGTYAYTAMLNALNYEADKRIFRRAHELPDAAVNEEGEEFSLPDVVGVMDCQDDERPDAIVERLQHIDGLRKSVSPAARILVDLISNPESGLYGEIQAVRHKNLLAKRLGFKSRIRERGVLEVGQELLIKFGVPVESAKLATNELMNCCEIPQ